MSKKLSIDRDRLVALIQTFYMQGVDDSMFNVIERGTPGLEVPEDITRGILFQLDMLEAESDLDEWERKEGLSLPLIKDKLDEKDN